MNFSLIATLTTAHALLHYCHHWLLALLFSKLLVSTLIFSFFSSLPVPDTFHYYRDLPRLNSPSRRYLRSGRLSTIFFSHFPHASHTFSFLLNTIVDRISNLNVIEIPVITVFLVWLTGRNERINVLMIKRCISERNLPIAIISCFFSFLLDFYVRIESSNL